MLKISFVLVFISLISFSTQTNYNYNQDFKNLTIAESNNTDCYNCHHPEVFWHFVDGMYDGLHIFKNVTLKKECLSIIPIFYDNFRHICNLFHHINTTKEFFDALHCAVDMLEDTYNQTLKREVACNSFCHQVQNVFHKTRKFMSSHLTYELVVKHMMQNLGVVIMKVEEMKLMLMNHKWYEAGFVLGDLVNFLTLWKLRPMEMSTPSENMIGMENILRFLNN